MKLVTLKIDWDGNITNRKGVASISLRTRRINDNADTDELDKLTGSTSEHTHAHFGLFRLNVLRKRKKNTYRFKGRIRSGIFFPVSVN